MSQCPLSFRVNLKGLPCAPHPCDKNGRPGIKFPRGINSPYWNNIRAHEIRKQRRLPWEDRCTTFKPAIQQCSVTEVDTTSPQGLLLAFRKSQCPCAKFFIPTIVRIADPAITKMEWIRGSTTLLTLLPGDNVTLSQAQQQDLSKSDVTIVVTFTVGSSTTTDTFNPVCFDPRAEFYSFFLQEVDAQGCTQPVV